MRARSRLPTAGADLRFARQTGDVATFEINGSRTSAVRVSSERHRRRVRARFSRLAQLGSTRLRRRTDTPRAYVEPVDRRTSVRFPVSPRA